MVHSEHSVCYGIVNGARNACFFALWILQVDHVSIFAGCHLQGKGKTSDGYWLRRSSSVYESGLRKRQKDAAKADALHVILSRAKQINQFFVQQKKQLQVQVRLQKVSNLP